MWFTKDKNDLILNIKVVPNSSINKIVTIIENKYLKVKIKSPPIDGAANKELIKYLSKVFKIPKSYIQIISGPSCKTKRVKLPMENDTMENFLKEYNL